MWYIKRITIRHQKTAFKIGTIFAILMVAICILGRSDTFIINTEISANDNKSELESTSSAHDNILKKLIPAVENCDDKSDATESSFQGNSTLHDSTSKIQNLTDAVTNMNNKAHTDENIKSRSTDNSTSHTSATSHTFSNKSSTLMQNTSRKAEKQSEHKVTTERKQLITKHLPTSQPDDMEVMQKQLNLTHCLFFYVEKEKMEYAKLDLWRVYVALKNIPPNVTTTTEKRIMFVTETLTDWNIEDLTISKQLMNELASTTGAIQQLKNLLSITDVKIMRLAQYGCEINQQLMLKQVMTNYESENALLRLKHELYILRPRVTTSSNTNVVVPLLYYPLLQRYVSLLVDTFSAKNDCLKSMQFCLHS